LKVPLIDINFIETFKVRFYFVVEFSKYRRGRRRRRRRRRRRISFPRSWSPTQWGWFTL